MLLDSTRHVKLADLGVTEEAKHKMVSGTVGTPAFMAPETLEGIPNKSGEIAFNGAALDIWALGVSLYCFVFGEVPFHDHAIIRLHEKILTKELKLEAMADKFQVSPECVDLISLILNRNPELRITIPEIRNHSWFTLIFERPGDMIQKAMTCNSVQKPKSKVVSVSDDSDTSKNKNIVIPISRTDVDLNDIVAFNKPISQMETMDEGDKNDDNNNNNKEESKNDIWANEDPDDLLPQTLISTKQNCRDIISLTNKDINEATEKMTLGLRTLVRVKGMLKRKSFGVNSPKKSMLKCENSQNNILSLNNNNSSKNGMANGMAVTSTSNHDISDANNNDGAGKSNVKMPIFITHNYAKGRSMTLNQPISGYDSAIDPELKEKIEKMTLNEN